MNTLGSIASFAVVCALSSCKHEGEVLPPAPLDQITYVDLQPDLTVSSVLCMGPEGAIPPDSSATMSIALLNDPSALFSITTSHWHQEDPNDCDNYYVCGGFPPGSVHHLALVDAPGGMFTMVRPFGPHASIATSHMWDNAGTIYWKQPGVPQVPEYGTEGDLFIGIKVYLDGSDHYGWISVNNSGGIMTIRSYAVNMTAGHQILAGQIE